MLEVLVTSSVLILALLLLRLAGSKVSARLRYALWGLVLVRLLLPGGLLPSAVSVMNAAPALERRMAETGNAAHIAPAPAESAPVIAITDPGPERNDVAGPPDTERVIPLAPPASAPIKTAMDWQTVLQWIWLAGACAVGGYFVLSNLLFCRKLRRGAEPFWEVDSPLPVYRADFLPSPCLVGLARPAIYLNAAASQSGQGLRHVLAHECCHKKHGDNWWALLRCLCLALWWFNPLVWLAAWFSRRDCELACDESALILLGEGERIPYGRTLVALTARPAGLDLLRASTAMTAGKRALKERIAFIGRSRRTKTVTALVAVLALVLAACTLTGEKILPAPPEPTPPPEETALVVPAGSGERKENFYTFLVIGCDTYGGNTDTILLAAYDVNSQKLNLMSLPRDTLVNVPWDIKKLNSVYSMYGGGEEGVAALRETVGKLVGFAPDFTVTVEWEGLGKLVDAIGGVDFDVPRDMYYNDRSQGFTIDLQKGSQHLNGAQATQLVRYRHDSDDSGNVLNSGYPDGDLGRVKVQQNFLKAVIEQCLEKITDLSTVKKLAQIFSDSVTTDLKAENLVWFAQQGILGRRGAPPLSMEKVRCFTMPTVSAEVRSRTYGTDPGYVAPAEEDLLQMLNQYFNPLTEDLWRDRLEVMYVEKNGTIGTTGGVLADKEYNYWLFTSSVTEPDPEAKARILAALEGIFDKPSTKGPSMWYFADPGSGPTGWDGVDRETVLPELKEIFSRYDWIETESDRWPEGGGIDLPEGGAASIWFFSGSRSFAMGFNSPFVTFTDETKDKRYYWTEHHRALYRELENLWYKYMEPWLRAQVVDAAKTLWQSGPVTVRLERADGSAEEKDGSDPAFGGEVAELFGGEYWRFLPGGPAEPPEGSATLTMSGGENQYDDIVVYSAGQYLCTGGYHHRALPGGDGEEQLFSNLCGIFSLTE